jgi:hypothetical protein
MVEDQRFEEKVVRSSLNPVVDNEVRGGGKANRYRTVVMALDDCVPVPVAA